MPEKGALCIIITDVDAADAIDAYLAAVNPLQEALDQLTWHHGLVIGLAQKDRADGGPGRVDRGLIIRLREQARQVILAAERTAEAIWEFTGSNVVDGELVPNHVPVVPPRGPQMDAAAAARETGGGLADTAREAHLDDERPELDVERDEVLAAMRWLRAGQPQEPEEADRLDEHHLALIRATQLGWVHAPPISDPRAYRLTNTGYGILKADEERQAIAAAEEAIPRGD